MIRTVERRARRTRRTECCGARVLPGDRYLEHVASPGHDDLGNTHWWRTTECAECARRYGRMGVGDENGAQSDG